MNKILPNLLALITRKKRYKPSINWSSKSWTHNVFRFYELIFWRRVGIRCESSTSSHYKSGKFIITRTFYTFESVVAFTESCIRDVFKFPKLIPIKITFPVPVTTDGIKMRSPYLFAIAFDASAGKRESLGVSPNTLTQVCTGTDLVLMINTSDDSNGVTSTAYNGSGATAISGAQVNGTNNVVSGPKMWYLVNPSTGSNSLITVAVGSDSLGVACTSYTGCLQTTPTDGTPGTATQESGTSITATMTVNTANSWLVGGFNNDQGNFGNGTGTTFRQVDANYSIADSNGTVSTGSQSLIGTYSNGRARGTVVTLLPVVTASTNNNLTLLGVS